ncbi:MAG: WD40 repeat domain-containing protein [Verrucomicrobiales bacterium]
MKLSLIHDHSLATGILGLATEPNAERVYAACADGAVYQVDIATGSVEAFESKHDSYASGCVLLPDGQTLISGGYDGQLIWHQIASKKSSRKLKAHSFWSWQLALTPDGARVASVTGQYLPGGWKYEPAESDEPCVKIFDTATGELVSSHRHLPPVLSCAFSPDGKHLAAGNMMGDVQVWEAGGSESPVAKWTSPSFTSWGSIKTHHYCGGIYALAFSPDGAALLGCGMGPMTDPMAGNGKMTWQRWDWRNGEKIDEIKDGQHGSGLMEALAWRPDGKHFVMAGKQAQGSWNAALFKAEDGSIEHSIDTKNRITQARFSENGAFLFLACANGQPQRKDGNWPSWGRLKVYRVEV